MRWFVDVSSVGKGSEKQSYCVDADSWQRALQATRSLRNDPGPMTGFSIELLDDGFSAVDPIKRVRYAIRKAPQDAPLTTGPTPGAANAPPKASSETPAPTSSRPSSSSKRTSSKPPPAEPASAAGARGAPASQPPQKRSSRPPAPELNLQPKGSGKNKGGVTPSPPRAVVASAPISTRRVEPTRRLEVLVKREQNPDDTTPLTYREYAYFIESPPGNAEAEKLLREHLTQIQGTIATAKEGKLVNLALFDVRFSERPSVPPLATLTWKDWKGDAIVTFPNVAPNAPPNHAPSTPNVSAPDAAPPVVPAAVSAAAPAVPTVPAALAAPAEQPVAEPVVRLATAPVASSSAALRESVAPPTMRTSETFEPKASHATAAKGRLRGDELIADLFDATHDLHFLRESIEGADFCLTLALEKMPARGGIVHLYDIDRREFVVTCAGGPGGETLLLKRAAESDAVLSLAMRKGRALVLSDAESLKLALTTERYSIFGGPKSLMVAPVRMGGRFLGAIELLNPIDDIPFNDDDGYALSYIAEQLATFVAERGISFERDQPPSTGRSASAR